MFSLKLGKRTTTAFGVILLTIVVIILITPINKKSGKSELPVDENISTFLSNLKDGHINKLDIKDDEIKTNDDNYANESLFIRGIKVMCETSIDKIEIVDRDDKNYKINIKGFKIKNVEPKNLESAMLSVRKEYEDGNIGQEEIKGKLISYICSNYNVEQTDERYSLDFNLKISRSGEIINRMTFINDLLEETGSVDSMNEYQKYYDTIYEKIRKELGE